VQENSSPGAVSELQIRSTEMKELSNLHVKLQEVMDSLKQLDSFKSDDAELAAMAVEEIAEKEELLEGLEEQCIQALLPTSEADSADALLEIRAGVGGTEGSLFAEDLHQMYEMFATSKGWKSRVLSLSKDNLLSKGCKEVVFGIRGRNAYGFLRYEAGVHK
jgi:peptide chain release factor 1